MNDDPLKALQREAAQLQQLAPWMKIDVSQEASGELKVRVSLVGGFEADAGDLAGSVVREIHRRLEAFEGRLDE